MKSVLCHLRSSVWCHSFLAKKFGLLKLLAKILAIILGKVRKILQDFSKNLGNFLDFLARKARLSKKTKTPGIG